MADKCKKTETSVAWQIYEICAPAPAPKPVVPAPSPIEAVLLDEKAQKANPWAIHCNHEEHCIIQTAERCEKVAKHLKFTEKVEVITKADKVAGCYRENGKTIFNKALASNNKLATRGEQFVICEQCNWVNPAPDAPAPAPKTRETLPPTTTHDGKRETDPPIAVASTKKSCKVNVGSAKSACFSLFLRNMSDFFM